jgi:hypothetical protein
MRRDVEDAMNENPWRLLPETAPYLLPSDRLAVEVFNQSADEAHRIHVDTPPEPFLGSINAPIVVLLLNPGVGDDEGRFPDLARSIRQAEPQEKHFYIGENNRWWASLTKSLVRDRPNVSMSRSILSVEYFPYRSKAFGCSHVRLPSQEYSFAIVREAILRKAIIVIARGERHWFGAVPELVAYEHRVRMLNPRKASLSERNLAIGGYEKLLSRLDGQISG